MTCPYCGKEMEAGTFRSRGCNHFLPDGKRQVVFYTKRSIERAGAIPLPPDPYRLSLTVDDWPAAHCCRDCKKIIIEYDTGPTA